jgi:hypothetical protein
MKFKLLGRILLALAILAILYFGFKFLGGASLMENFNKENIKAAGPSNNSESSATGNVNNFVGSKSSVNSNQSNTEEATATKIFPNFKLIFKINGCLKVVKEYQLYNRLVIGIARIDIQ